ncbi:hypothetical protein BDR03DRAFT_1017264 [Suillus americanus]|nr:hypothetical protein BDR03DRAFT_1017264 [Suillus americanus]
MTGSIMIAPSHSVPSNLSKDLSSQTQSSQYGTQIDPQQLDESPAEQTDQYPAKLSDSKPVSVDHTPKKEVLEGQRSDGAETAGVSGAAIGAAQICNQSLGKTMDSKPAESAEAGGTVGATESVKEAGVEDKARDDKEVFVHGQGAKAPQQPGDEQSTKNNSAENRMGDVGKVTDDRGSDEDITMRQLPPAPPPPHYLTILKPHC